MSEGISMFATVNNNNNLLKNFWFIFLTVFEFIYKENQHFLQHDKTFGSEMYKIFLDIFLCILHVGAFIHTQIPNKKKSKKIQDQGKATFYYQWKRCRYLFHGLKKDSYNKKCAKKTRNDVYLFIWRETTV